MSVFHPVFFVVFAIVARGDHRFVLQGDGGLHFGFGQFVGGGTFDAYRPLVAVGFVSPCYHLASHIDKVVVDVHLFKKLSYQVDDITLGDGIEVDFGFGMLLDDDGSIQTVDIQCDATSTGEASQAVDDGVGHILSVFEAKSPSVDQLAHGDIKGSAAVGVHLQRLFEQLQQDAVEQVGFVAVDSSEQRVVDP